MDRDRMQPPRFWIGDLTQAEQDVFCGRVVSAESVLTDLRGELAELESELNATEPPTGADPHH